MTGQLTQLLRVKTRRAEVCEQAFMRARAVLEGARQAQQAREQALKAYQRTRAEQTDRLHRETFGRFQQESDLKQFFAKLAQLAEGEAEHVQALELAKQECVQAEQELEQAAQMRSKAVREREKFTELVEEQRREQKLIEQDKEDKEQEENSELRYR